MGIKFNKINLIGHVNIHWNYLLIYWKFPMILTKHLVNSDWLFNTQPRVLQADWFILEINEKANLNMNMP